MILKADALADCLAGKDRPDRADDPLAIVPEPDLDDLRLSGAAAIDLHLGCWFVALRRSRLDSLELSGETSESKVGRTYYVRMGTWYVLHPGDFVLGGTFEWIRLPSDLAAYVVGKSSLGRRGLVIATATGVHPGWTGCLTLELGNVGEVPLRLRPGRPICQLCVHSVKTEDWGHNDASQFIGRRRPTIGAPRLDRLAERLQHLFPEP